MTQQWEAWAYVSPDGKIKAGATCESHAWAWRSIDFDSVEEAKQRGARVIRVQIEEIEE